MSRVPRWLWVGTLAVALISLQQLARTKASTVSVVDHRSSLPAVSQVVATPELASESRQTNSSAGREQANAVAESLATDDAPHETAAPRWAVEGEADKRGAGLLFFACVPTRRSSPMHAHAFKCTHAHVRGRVCLHPRGHVAPVLTAAIAWQMAARRRCRTS